MVFTARRYASAVLAMALCLSVRSSVRSRSSTKTAKRRFTQQHMIAQGLYFSYAKDLREIRPGSPPAGRQIQVGWAEIGDFRLTTSYISKTVQDRRMVSIKVE